MCRVKFVNWFVKEQLYDYKQSFRVDHTYSQLSHVDRRYAWLQHEFSYLHQTYKIFNFYFI